MKRITVLSLLLLLVTTLAFAHAGEVHTYLGTITEIRVDGSFVIRIQGEKKRAILVSKNTTYTHADGHTGKQSELKVGKRVAVRISKDGKTALNVKFSANKSGN